MMIKCITDLLLTSSFVDIAVCVCNAVIHGVRPEHGLNCLPLCQLHFSPVLCNIVLRIYVV